MQKYTGPKANYEGRARAKVFKRDGVWCYQVRDAYGRYVLADNAADYDLIMREAMLSVWGVRRIEIAGHYLEYTWPEILHYRVDAIPGYLRNKRKKWIG